MPGRAGRKQASRHDAVKTQRYGVPGEGRRKQASRHAAVKTQRYGVPGEGRQEAGMQEEKPSAAVKIQRPV